MPQRSVLKRVITLICLLGFGLVLASCDKCGNSLFRVDGSPAFCQDRLPR